MNILLLMPEAVHDSWPVPNDVIGRVMGGAAATFPQLAGAVPGHEVKVYDGLVQRTPLRKYIALLQWADVIGINMVSSLATLNTLITIRLAKKANPGVKIVLGGHHATFYHREWVGEGVDYVVRREGERTFAELLDALARGGPVNGIEGISYREDAATRENPDRPFVADLDSLPLPRWDIMDLGLYNLNLRKEGRTATIETSRGCTHRCSFCNTAAMWKNTQRFKSPGRVLEELEILTRRGVSQVAVIDDNFGIAQERDTAILEGILRKNMHVSFWSFLRTDTVVLHPEFIGLFARAGLREVIVGFETMDGKLLESYSKGLRGGLTPSDYARAYDVLHRNGVFVCGSFVVGHPDDPAGSVTVPHGAYAICDFLLPIPFLPMKGIQGYDALAKKVGLRDVFLHHRFLPAFNGAGKGRSTLRSLFRLSAIRQAIGLFLSRSWVQRRFVRVLVWNLAKGALRVSWWKIRDALTLFLPGLSPEDKAAALKRSYLDEGVISSLATPTQQGLRRRTSGGG